VRATLANPSTRRILLVGFTSFFLIGVLLAGYGPAFLDLTRRYGVGLDLAALTLTVHFAASMVTVAAAGMLLARFGYRAVFVWAAAATAVGALGAAWAPSFGALIAAVAVVGLGFGLLDVGTNLLIARAFAPNSAPALNILNATFGLGAVAGPAAVALAGGRLVGPMVAATVLGVLLLVLALKLPEPPRLHEAAASRRVPWASALSFVALVGLYVSSETAVGSWMALHLTERLGETAAAAQVSLYWAALTLGRLRVAPVAARVAPGVLVVGVSVLAAAALALTFVPASAAGAYLAVGLLYGPIFPTAMAWLQRTYPERSEQVASVVFAGSGVISVGTPVLIGAAVERGGVDVIPVALLAFGAGTALVALLQWRGVRRAQDGGVQGGGVQGSGPQGGGV
jgi:fucose permease